MIDTQNIVNKMLITHYEEIDSTLYNVMAAGVSESEIRKHIILTEPKLEVTNNTVNVTSYLGFKVPAFEVKQ